MSTFTLLLIGLVTLTQAIPDKQYDLNDAERHFEEFIQTYGKKYANEEEKASRFEIFKETLTDINKKNLEEDLAEFGITQFADLTFEEFIKFRGGYRKREIKDDTESCKNHNSVPDVNVPESWDWNKKGAVTSVKQQECGDCYAFSAIGNVEGQSQILTKNLTEYSVQQIVDCDPLDNHCSGGDMQQAIVSLVYMYGPAPASEYPYKGKQEPCKFDIRMTKIQVTGCDTYQNITENDLMKLVYQRGPLSIGIDATSLFKYTKGIMKQCVHESPNHGVLLVGYGTEDGVPYWLFKNSWGTEFGEKGYFRVKRGIDACGLVDYEITSAIVEPV